MRKTLDEIGHSPVMCEALGSITSIETKLRRNRSGRRSLEELEVVEKRVIRKVPGGSGLWSKPREGEAEKPGRQEQPGAQGWGGACQGKGGEVEERDWLDASRRIYPF